MHQTFARIQISHQELLTKILIFSQIFYIPVLIIQFSSLNFHQSLNWQILLLPLKRVTEVLRKTMNQSEYFQTSQKSLNDASFIRFPILWFLSIKATMWVYKRLQYTVLPVGETGKTEKRSRFEALLTDLSKAFNCVCHELLIAKLHAYGFEVPALKLIQSYLSNRKQGITINLTYSSCEEIKESKMIYSWSFIFSYFSVWPVLDNVWN